jgi:hypothetical protein
MSDPNDEVWDRAWFVSRVIVGMILQLFLFICSFALAELAFEVALTLPDYKMARWVMASMACIAAFTAGISGSFLVKSLYIRWALPEIMEDEARKNT